MKVFVYGTLRRGFSNHGLLMGADFLCFGTTEGRMFADYIGFPYVSLRHKGVIRGEVYDVTEQMMSNLNRLEGYQGEGEKNFYERSIVEVKKPDGEIIEAYIYHIDRDGYWSISDGDWASFKRR